MFKDVQLSKELGSRYKELYETGPSESRDSDMQLNVNVCSTSYWPASKQIPFHFPKELEGVCDKYRRFYLHSHSGHKLAWRVDQGLAEVQVDFSPRVKRTLVVTTYQVPPFAPFPPFLLRSLSLLLSAIAILRLYRFVSGALFL
jgi:hypothetical protein